MKKGFQTTSIRRTCNGEFPISLTGFRYDRILDRLVASTVPKARRDNIRKLLGWLACARRPLKWHEIQGATTVDLDEGVVSAKRQFREDCKELCLSLVEIAPDQTVTLVHSTTKPYEITNIGASRSTYSNRLQVLGPEKILPHFGNRVRHGDTVCRLSQHARI